MTSLKSLAPAFRKNFLSIISLAIAMTSVNHSAAQSYAAPPYFEGFESGSVDGTYWTTTTVSSANDVRVYQSGALQFGGMSALSHSGNYFLGMHHANGGSFGTTQAKLHLDLANSINVVLDFWWAEWNDETSSQDGVYFSDDGGLNFTKMLDLNGGEYTDLQYQNFVLKVDSLAAENGLSLTSNFVIMFQQYDDYYLAGGNDGFLLDDISVSADPCPNQSYVSPPYFEGFESDSIDGTYWTTTTVSSANDVRVYQSGALQWSGMSALSHSGNYFLGMHHANGGFYGTTQAKLHLDLVDQKNVVLDFWWAEWNDETEPQDGVYFSDDCGLNFTKILDLNGGEYTDLQYQNFVLNVDSLAAENGLSLTSNFVIMFQQYDDYYLAGGNDGFLIDDISVSADHCPGQLVTSTADDGPGTLREAFRQACAFDTIRFDPAINGDTIKLDSQLYIDTSVVILGNGWTNTIIDGQQKGRVFLVEEDVRLELHALTVQNGKTLSGGQGSLGDRIGGGIYNLFGELLLNEVKLWRNMAGEAGGGMICYGNTVIRNSLIAENRILDVGGDGGGLSNNGGTMDIEYSLIRNNGVADYGGGIDNDDNGIMHLNYSRVTRNLAHDAGGGISNDGILYVYKSTIDSNYAADSDFSDGGGGIHNSRSKLYVSNSTISNNIGSRGGAIKNGFESKTRLSFVSMNGNAAVFHEGGAVWTQDTVQLDNTVMSGNGSSPGPEGYTTAGGLFISNGYNLVRDTSGMDVHPAMGDRLGNSQVPLDAGLLPLAGNGGPTPTNAVGCPSPLINAANPDSMGTDQRGFLVYEGRRDIGAFERQSYCDPYCEAGGNNQYGWISQVTALNGGMSNSSGADPDGYGNYRHLTACNPNTDRYYFYLDNDGPLSSSSAYWRAWIDWDQSETFDPWEQVIQKNTSGGFYATVFIPTWIPDDQYIMRIAMNQFSGYPDPCGDLTYGEYEDYSICKGQEQAPPPPRAQSPDLRIFTDSDPSIRIYPNPVSDLLTIELDAAQDGTRELRVISPLGKTVYSGEWTATQSDHRLQLDVRQWPAGLYYLEVSSGERQWIVPFVRSD